MKLIRDFFRKEWKAYIVIVSVLIIVDLLQVVIPYFTRNSVNSIVSKNSRVLILNVSLILGAGFLIVVLRYLYNSILRFQVLKFDYDLKNKLYQKYLYLKREDLQKFEIGDLMARVTNDTMSVRMFLIMGFFAIVDIFVLGITTFGSMLILSRKLALITVWPLVFLIPVTLNFGKKIHKIFKNVQSIFAEMTVRVREVIGGIRVIKSFVREDYYLHLFRNVNESYLRENIKLVKLDGFLDPTINFFINISLANLVIFGSNLVVKNQVEIGTVVAFFQYILTLAWPVMAIGFFIALTQRARASLSRINEILELNVEDTNKGRFIDLRGEIFIRNLTFSYSNGQNVLNNINLKLDDKKILGVTGLPGSGKTTLINLILRIYEPEKGQIFINGFDITEVSLNCLRSQITFVPQEPFLFADTILNNIKVGNPDATFEEVVEAAKLASIHEDIMKFVDGYNTLVGEQGITLSGGEKQRLSIARAVITKKPIMLFDDPFSAVDADTEMEIIKNLREFLIGNSITAILVSQRVNALSISDYMAVLDKGKLIEFGEPEKLIKEEGFYYHLYRRQLLEGVLS